MARAGDESMPTSPAAGKGPMKQYRGLVDNISHIKETVDNERRRGAHAQKQLEDRLRESQLESSKVQKELSVQLRCAGRSYQHILDAVRDLQEQLAYEKEMRVEEKKPPLVEIKQLKQELSNAAKPWKEEIAKRDLQIIKLQEQATEKELKLRDALAVPGPLKIEMQKAIDAAEAKVIEVQKDVVALQEEMEVIPVPYIKEIQRLKEKNLMEVTVIKTQLDEHIADANKIAGPYIKKVQELEEKIKNLIVELGKVDYSRYEGQVTAKEKGYELLVKDYRTKESTHADNVDQMREGFEFVIAKLDKKLQKCEKEFEKKLAPWPVMVESRELEIERLKGKIEDLKQVEADFRVTAKADFDLVAKELGVAKEVVEILVGETNAMKEQLEGEKVAVIADGGPKRRIKILESQLDETTTRCEVLLKQRDREVKEKAVLVARLQDRVLLQSKENVTLDLLWDDRVQLKEEGYGIVVAQLAHAEGQILEEREKTKAAMKEIKKREERIAALDQIHQEELKVRFKDREVLAARIFQLEEEIQRQWHDDADEARMHWEELYDEARVRAEEREADLEVEIVRRDRARVLIDKELTQVRDQFEKARMTWENKERELEVTVRARDRLINALKNEIELVSESWEIKYNKLMSLFDKLQKKYDELLGPGGLAETLRRAKDLKEENVSLTKQLEQFKEMFKKQKRQIRDLQLDIDMHMKETADILSQKERGIAEMVGDYAKLETIYRKECEVKEKITAELMEEKRNIVSSFQSRLEQLEQLVEAMRFTDREDLLDNIDVWKRAYERICIQRDESEEEFQGLIVMKDKQLRRMAIDNSEERAMVIVENERSESVVQKTVSEWKLKVAVEQSKHNDYEKVILEKDRDMSLLHMEVRRAKGLADDRLIDPEKEGLKEVKKELETKVENLQLGVQKFIEEIASLQSEIDILSVKVEAESNDWEPQIRWRDERHEAMLKEHDHIKEVLFAEMQKAQDTCKAIEAQVRKFPNPFEIELKEMQDRYAQMQAGQQKMSFENLHLKEEILDLEEKSAAEKKALEKEITMAHHILEGMGVIKDLHKQLKVGSS